MLIMYRDELYDFWEIFNDRNGMLIRGDSHGSDPHMRSFPELIDVGIMGHCQSRISCSNAGIDCYQCGNIIQHPHMSLDDFTSILSQSAGKVLQVALGGAGDPNKHPEFVKFLQLCRRYHIVPNLTTSGYQLTYNEISAIKQYCGAVAVSWYSRLNNSHETNTCTVDAVDAFVKAGCVTNIHFVLSNETIDEALQRLTNNLFPSGISAIIFLMYKPVGNGVQSKVLKPHDNRLHFLFSLIEKQHFAFRIGFDTCFTPAVLRFMSSSLRESVDSCEAGTFSMYIDSQMNCFPCSFGLWDRRFSESLHEKSIREIWLGPIFTSFRDASKQKCLHCKMCDYCRGGCKLGLDIDLC